jgi:hypothetical protein
MHIRQDREILDESPQLDCERRKSSTTRRALRSTSIASGDLGDHVRIESRAGRSPALRRYNYVAFAQLAHAMHMNRHSWGFPSLSAAPTGLDLGGEVIDVARLTGIFTMTETLKEGRSLSGMRNPDFNLLPQQLLRSSGVPAHVIDHDFGELQLHARDELYSVDAVAYFARLLERLIQCYTLQVDREWNVIRYFVFTELHCPHRRGAVATFHRGAGHEKVASFELKVLGFKGGDGTTATVNVTSAIEAKDGRCYRIAIPVELRVQECSFRRGPSRQFDSFLRVSLVRCSEGFRQEPIAAPCPHCNLGAGGWPKDTMSVPYDLKRSSEDETAMIELTIEEDHRAKAGMELKVPGLLTSL